MAPFLVIFYVILITYGFEKLLVAIEVLDTNVSEGEARRNRAGRGEAGEKLVETLLCFMFPLLMNFSFSCTSSVYLMSPV
jgi:hypothetical protein